MCYPPGARPPDIPFDLLPPMTGGSGGEEVTLTSADGTKFRAHLARADQREAGVVIAPDVRGLHSFYEDLADRFASAGIHAIAFDYFGRTAGMDRRADDFSAEQSGLAGVVGFYGRLGKRENEVWPVPAEQAARMRAPVLGLFGGDDPSIPPSDIDAFDSALATAKVKRHLETYPGAPHSFFDRTFSEHKKECDDAWRRVLGFMTTGDPAKTA